MNKLLCFVAFNLLIFLAGCSQEQTFEDLIAPSSDKIMTNNFRSEKLGYSISLLKNLTLTDTEYTSDYSIEVFIDTVMFEQSSVRSISIMRIEKRNSSLEKQWKSLTGKRKLPANYEVKSTGTTNFLKELSYYEHISVSNAPNKDFETITFLTKGDVGVYYCICITCGMDDNYPVDIKKLLQCVKTFSVAD